MRCFILLLSLLLSSASYTHAHSIHEPIPEAIQSIYSSKITQLLDHWSQEIQTPGLTDNPVWYRAIKTPKQPLYIGTIKKVRVQAPLQRVATLIEEFEAYPKLFEDVKKVEILSKDQNKWTVRWERYSPVFFIPNIKYEMIYIIEKTSASKMVYRYQLKSGNSVTYSDGLIVLETEGNSTFITGLDFFNANWGLAGTFGEGKIWNDSVEGAFRGDLAMKFHAEHEDWDRKRIQKEVDTWVDRYPVKLEYLATFLEKDRIPAQSFPMPTLSPTASP